MPRRFPQKNSLLSLIFNNSSSVNKSTSGLTLSSTIYNSLSCEDEKMSQSLRNNINSFNTTYTAVSVSNNLTVADDRSSILTWLSPMDPKLQHQGIQDCRVGSIGEWLLQTKEFRSWRAGSGGGESDNSVLFCYGDPGVGKTYIR